MDAVNVRRGQSTAQAKGMHEQQKQGTEPVRVTGISLGPVLAYG